MRIRHAKWSHGTRDVAVKRSSKSANREWRPFLEMLSHWSNALGHYLRPDCPSTQNTVVTEMVG